MKSKTKGGNVKACPNPKWGTVEWIRVYPWSLMDRKRRKRVKAILPRDLVDLLDADAGRVPFLHAVAKCVTDAKARPRAFMALAHADRYARDIVDMAVASALADVWLRGRTAR